jgi:TetR/AcrR family transcriptional repressor of nem operon
MASGDTKERLLDAGAALVKERGFQGSGIQQVLKAAGVPRGSFYHYFGSKEDFGLALVERFAEELVSRLEEFLGDAEYPPLLRLARFFGFFHAMFEDGGYRGGTPFGMIALEMSAKSQRFKERIDSAYMKVEELIRDCIKEAQDAGVVSEGLDAGNAAIFIMSAWEGAVLRMRAAGEAGPLRVFEAMVFGRLLA